MQLFKKPEDFEQEVYERIHFDNGYGASIIRHPYSYGNESGLFELAVLKNGEICYDTHITNDAIGWLTEEKVNEILEEIKKL